MLGRVSAAFQQTSFAYYVASAVYATGKHVCAEQLKAKQEQAFEEQKQQLATAVLRKHLEARVAEHDAKRGRATSTAWKAIPGAAAELPRNVVRQRTRNAATGNKFLKKLQGVKLASASKRDDQQEGVWGNQGNGIAGQPSSQAVASLATTLPGMVERFMSTVETWSPRSQTESLHKADEEDGALSLIFLTAAAEYVHPHFHWSCDGQLSPSLPKPSSLVSFSGHFVQSQVDDHRVKLVHVAF